MKIKKGGLTTAFLIFIGETTKRHKMNQKSIVISSCIFSISVIQLFSNSNIPDRYKEYINMRTDTFITVLGSSTCKYDEENDTASYLLNNNIIIDTGWNLTENIRNLGLNPALFKTILFTHMHHDHYIALPQFLFYHLCERGTLCDLTLIGTSEVAAVTDLAMNFLQVSRFYEKAGCPKCIQIKPNESIVLKAENLIVEAQQSVHTVDGRYYKITDTATNAVAGFSGDTAYSPIEGTFFKGCGILVHECSLGAKIGASYANNYLHASAQEAARAASEAGAKKLMLTHYPENFREDCIAAAKLDFSGEILTPVKGDIITI